MHIPTSVAVKIGRHTKIAGDGRYVCFYDGKIGGRAVRSRFGKTAGEAVKEMKEELARVGFEGEITYEDVGNLS